MKSKVQLSKYAFLLTLVVNGVLLAGCILTFGKGPGFWIFLGVLAFLIILGLLYAPVSIISTPDKVTIKTVLNKRSIPINEIENVELFQPTMGAYRLCASGGYFGYWGLFREGDIGKYFAFYGKASDCFLITMKKGDKYVLGCINPGETVDYIKQQIK